MTLAVALSPRRAVEDLFWLWVKTVIRAARRSELFETSLYLLECMCCPWSCRNPGMSSYKCVLRSHDCVLIYRPEPEGDENRAAAGT